MNPVLALEERLRLVEARIGRAAARSGREASCVSLIAVTKGVQADTVRDVRALGVVNFGENRVQEASTKISEAGIDGNWHLIGHLQTNKVRHALPLFRQIHSLDRPELALEIERQCERMDLTCRALVQVNVSGEDTKYGVPPGDLLALLKLVSSLDHVSVEGLMTIAPYTDNPETARPVFRELARLSRVVTEENYPRVTMRHLSMGMSGDFEVAIEEGATMVRVGTAIFGPRPKPVTV